jgi:hypothetical protein
MIDEQIRSQLYNQIIQQTFEQLKPQITDNSYVKTIAHLRGKIHSQTRDNSRNQLQNM